MHSINAFCSMYFNHKMVRFMSVIIIKKIFVESTNKHYSVWSNITAVTMREKHNDGRSYRSWLII